MTDLVERLRASADGLPEIGDSPFEIGPSKEDFLRLAADEIERLRSLQAPALPVAWRWRGPKGGWLSSDVKPAWPCEPLYAAPAPPPVDAKAKGAKP